MNAMLDFVMRRSAGELALILICAVVGMFAAGMVAGEALYDVVSLFG